MAVIDPLIESGVIRPPAFMKNNVHYETMMGSIAYGVATNASDVDVYGFCIPSKDLVFPHLAGEIAGFDHTERFEQYQQHGVSWEGKSLDISIYSIVRFFYLCMENNPNMLDSLYTPANCVLHITQMGQIVRDSRDLFLHKGYYHKSRGYAFSQMNKMKRDSTGKRKELVDAFGYDVKAAYHVIRLMEQCEQVLSEGTLDLQRSRDVLIAVRKGMWTEQEVRDYFSWKEAELGKLYHSSTLRYKPNQPAIKRLLLDCLEHHFGSLADVVPAELGKERAALEKIREIADLALL